MKRKWSGQVVFTVSDQEAAAAAAAKLRTRQPSVKVFISDGTGVEAPEHSLFLTDTPKIAKTLWEAGLAVAGYEHDGNGDRDFSFLPYVVSEPWELEKSDFLFIWNRITGSPCDILETERLKVRETTVEDVDAFYGLYREPGITEYMEALFDDPEEERAYQEAYIRNVYGFYGYGIWTVIEKRSGKVIGRAGIAPREGFAEPELGFMIGKEWQGKGYAFEVCSAILAYAYGTLRIPAVIAVVHARNKGSGALCRKLGFSCTNDDIVKNHQIFKLKLSDFYNEMH